MIRFDTAKKTLLSEVGKDGTISYNVGWGGPTLVVKGENHDIDHNTVVGGIQVVRYFGAACGMNKDTTTAFNAAKTIMPRGTCTDGGKTIKGMPKDTHDNVAVASICDQLMDCEAFDFRPKNGSAVAKKAAGAYDAGATKYWLPGRLNAAPGVLVPKSGTSVWHEDAALIFVPARAEASKTGTTVEECENHEVFLSTKRSEVARMAGPAKSLKKKTLSNATNVWSGADMGLVKGKTYFWRVNPNCTGAQKSAVWKFKTLAVKPTTTTTTTAVAPTLIVEKKRCKGKSFKTKKNVPSATACAAETDASHRFFTYCAKQKLCVVEQADCSATNSMRGQKSCNFYKAPSSSLLGVPLLSKSAKVTRRARSKSLLRRKTHNLLGGGNALLQMGSSRGGRRKSTAVLAGRRLAEL